LLVSGQANSSLQLAADEVIIKGMNELFRDVSSYPFTYRTDSPAIRLTNVVEQKFGDLFMTQWSNCTKVVPVSTLGTIITYAALCNTTSLAVFKYSLDSYSIDTWDDLVITSKPVSMNCTGLHFNQNSQWLITTCLEVNTANSLLVSVYSLDLRKLFSIDLAQTQLAQKVLYKAEPIGFNVSSEKAFVVAVYDKDREATSASDRIVVQLFTIQSNVMKYDSAVELDPSVGKVMDLRVQSAPAVAPQLTISYFHSAKQVQQIDQLQVLRDQATRWVFANRKPIEGLDQRKLTKESRTLVLSRDADAYRYFEVDWTTQKVSMCDISQLAIVHDSCVSANTSIALSDLVQPADFTVGIETANPHLTFTYRRDLAGEALYSVMGLFNIQNASGFVHFEQIADKFCFGWSVVNETIFAIKGMKYSVYKPTTRQTLAFVHAKDVQAGGELAYVEQWRGDSLNAKAAISLSTLTDMKKDYGFISNLPDFAGFLDYDAPNSFSREYMYGNNLRVRAFSNSTISCSVEHLTNLTYSFGSYQLTKDAEFYFADKFIGLVKYYNSSAGNMYYLRPFRCSLKNNSNTAMDCRISQQIRASPIVPDIAKIHYVSLNATKGLICIIQTQTQVNIVYFPDDQAIEKEEKSIQGVQTAVVFYVLKYDGYIAISDVSKNQIQIWKLPSLSISGLVSYFNITAGSTGIPKSYFCPTALDVCPDNPSVLDVLSNCPDDTRVLKFNKGKNDNYYLFDINTLNHPYILPDEELTFCTMGNELIVHTKYPVNESIKIYGRITAYDGALSYHTFNFRDFGISKINKITCQNDLRGFVVSGKDINDNYIFAVMFGNAFGQANRKYSIITKTESLIMGSFAVSKDEAIVYYTVSSNTNFGFNLIELNGPFLNLKFTQDANYNSMLDVVIDRSEYKMESVSHSFQVNMMPAKNSTQVVPKRLFPTQIANFSLDNLIKFEGHVLSANLIQSGDSLVKATISPRLVSFFSAQNPNISYPTDNLKYNRLYRLEQRIVALSNDSDNSYLYFYSDYYSLEPGGDITISGFLCQNLDISSGDSYYFIVLKCNNYNVFNILYLLTTKSSHEAKQQNILYNITDEVVGVSIGRAGKNTFMIAKNLVTGLTFSVVRVNPDDLSVAEKDVKVETKSKPG